MSRWRLRHDPAYNSCQQIIANLSAVAQIDILETLCAVYEIQDALSCHVPYTTHPPTKNAFAATLHKCGEAIVGHMKAIVDVDMTRARSYKGTDGLFQYVVCDATIVS